MDDKEPTQIEQMEEKGQTAGTYTTEIKALIAALALTSMGIVGFLIGAFGPDLMGAIP